MKKCFKCGEDKNLSEYYKHSGTSDGYLNKCKQCAKNDSNKHRKNNLEIAKAYDRSRSNSPHRVAKRKEVAEKWKNDPVLKKRSSELKKIWQENNKQKRHAHVVTGNAIRDGKIIRQPCEVCGKSKVDAHHDDYSQPLSVRWLCREHHVEHHKNEREKHYTQSNLL